jgi:C4-dicarboxylate-specific signal transduction histidine kinase
MHPKPVNDIEALAKMTKHLEEFQRKLQNETLPVYERQALEAAIIGIKSHMETKTRDIRRRMREQCEYE